MKTNTISRKGVTCYLRLTDQYFCAGFLFVRIDTAVIKQEVYCLTKLSLGSQDGFQAFMQG